MQVLIFAEKKQDVDAIHEYLLLKGVEAVAIHGGKGIPHDITIQNPSTEESNMRLLPLVKFYYIVRIKIKLGSYLSSVECIWSTCTRAILASDSNYFVFLHDAYIHSCLLFKHIYIKSELNFFSQFLDIWTKLGMLSAFVKGYMVTWLSF